MAAGCVLFCAAARAADDFGDILVSPNAFYTGNTYHGYGEMRVVLENHSPTRTHVVTLEYPNHASHYSGNSISRVARSVSLAPDAREVVSLLQPPLPAPGDGSIRVEVDGHHEGEVRAPNANNHCNYYSRGGRMAAVLVSRSLDFDAVNLMLQPEGAAGSGGVAGSVSSPASEAMGPPRAFSSGRKNLSLAWMPDFRSRSTGHWLELDYAPTLTVTNVIIHSVQSALSAGNLALVGAAGTNLLTLAMTSANISSDHGHGWNVEFTFPQTSAPVKTVRIDFGTTRGGLIAIDGVQISGPAGSQWASAARASSECRAFGPRGFSPGGVNPDNVESLRAESPVPEWSENWLAYSPFDAVVVNDADVAVMTPAVFAALGDYVEAGGNLVVLGQSDLPAAWHAASTAKLHDGAEYEIGFGNAFAFAPANPSSLEASAVQRVRAAVRETARYFETLPNDSGAANAVMQVVGNVKIPVRGIVIMMLAFVVVIGPVNLVYLNRIKRRTWMLWTIPAISLATTLLVFAYSMLREGITPDTRIRGLTILDQVSHQAATIGGEAFYCPLTPSGGLQFELATEATPLVSVDSGVGAGTSREVDWTHSQHFQRGWVSARVPAHFHVRKSETRRERIQILNQGGKLQVVNSLGAPIRSIWFADVDMEVFAANNIDPGEKAGLSSAMIMNSEKSGAQGLWRDLGFAAAPDTTNGSVGKYLLPNTYVAVLDGNPFLENALGAASSPKRTKNSCVVFGILEVDEKATGAK